MIQWTDKMRICDICHAKRTVTRADCVRVMAGKWEKGRSGIEPLVQEELTIDLCEKHQKEFGQILLNLKGLFNG